MKTVSKKADLITMKNEVATAIETYYKADRYINRFWRWFFLPTMVTQYLMEKALERGTCEYFTSRRNIFFSDDVGDKLLLLIYDEMYKSDITTLFYAPIWGNYRSNNYRHCCRDRIVLLEALHFEISKRLNALDNGE